MNLAGVAGLPTITLTQSTWYRAVPIAYAGAPLGTGFATSRFCSLTTPYHLIYLAADQTTALLEVQALVRSAHLPRPLPVAVRQYVVFPITVGGVQVVDLGDVGARTAIQTTAQELTGNWLDYPNRGPNGAWPNVRSNRTDAPTQELGAQLHASHSVAGFLSASAHKATQSNLVIFPKKVTVNEHINPQIGPLAAYGA